MSNNLKSLKKANLVKDTLFQMLYEQWYQTLTSIFVYEGLGNDEVGNYIEKTLFEQGRVVIFEDDKDGVTKALPIAQRMGLNVYGEPIKWTVLGANGFRKDLDNTNSVLIKNNKNSTSFMQYVMYIIERLVNVENAIDVNVNQLKVPFIFSGTEASLLTMKNVYKKITNNEPVIYLDKKVDINVESKLLPTGVQYHGEELMKLYNDFEGRLLKIFGLKYVHTEKKERLVVDEVNSNDGYSNTNLWSMLKERENGINKLKERYPNKYPNAKVSVNPLLLNINEDKGKESENEDERY